MFLLSTGLRKVTSTSIETIEKVYEVILPLELRNYLSSHLDDEIVDGLTWRSSPQEIKSNQDSLFRETLEFDIKNNDYWPKVFGERPEKAQDRVDKAFNCIKQFSPLIPVGGLKYYVPTQITDPSRPLPVISFQQFVDTIFMYKNLGAYSCGDSHISAEEYSQLLGVPGWDDVFDGLGASEDVLYI